MSALSGFRAVTNRACTTCAWFTQRENQIWSCYRVAGGFFHEREFHPSFHVCDSFVPGPVFYPSVSLAQDARKGVPPFT